MFLRITTSDREPLEPCSLQPARYLRWENAGRKACQFGHAESRKRVEGPATLKPRGIETQKRGSCGLLHAVKFGAALLGLFNKLESARHGIKRHSIGVRG